MNNLKVSQEIKLELVDNNTKVSRYIENLNLNPYSKNQKQILKIIEYQPPKPINFYDEKNEKLKSSIEVFQSLDDKSYTKTFTNYTYMANGENGYLKKKAEMDLSSISDLISPNGIHKEVIFNHGGKVGAKAVKKKVGHSYYSYELYCGVQLLKFDFKNGLGRYLNSNENGRLFSMRMDNALYCVIGFCIIRNTVPMLRIVDFYEGLFCKNPTVVKTYLY